MSCLKWPDFRWGCAAVAVLLGACSLIPAYEREPIAMPEHWQNADAAQGSTLDVRWWAGFGSAELDALMGEAIAANRDLAAAVARIAQARAAATVAGSPLWPSAGVSVSAERSLSERDDSTEIDSEGQALLSVAYELDLWGGNAAAATSARAETDAAIYDRDTVALVLQADVAANFFQVLALKDRIELAERNLDTARQLMHLVEVRFKAGAANALELAQQRTSLLAAQAELPPLQLSLAQTQHALAVLLGRAPQGFAVHTASLSALRLPTLAGGQPDELLTRRPDIRAAEARLIAANADIGAARAALFPGVELSASAGVTGLLDGGSSTVASIVASLAQTLFDGGGRRAQVRLSQARREELVQDYAQSVLTGLQEVEDSLVSLQANAQRAQLLAQTAAQAREALRLAQTRYRAGAEDLLAVLDSQRSAINADDSRVQAELARFMATASLVKALGGSGLAAPAG